MAKNILIPTDFSENARNAIAYAQQLFKKTDCNFYILHINDFLNHPTVSTHLKINEAQLTEKVTELSKNQLNGLLKEIENNNTNKKHLFFGLHDIGFFIESLRKHLKEKKIDLIVMGTKGASGLKKMIIGSNTGDVITKIQCNTLVVPKTTAYDKLREIVFPTDYNIFYSHKILKAIYEIASLDNSTIRVMNVSKLNGFLTEPQEKNKDYLQDYLNETFPKKNNFHTITNKAVPAAIQCFVESREIDMIVMVAKNLNFIQQILFDSIVEKISFHTTIPFFVIHE